MEQGEKISINDITCQFVELNATERAEPVPANAEVYRELQSLQGELSLSLRDSFAKHRKFILR